MELIATDPTGTAAVLAHGATLHGSRLRCAVLLVRAGQPGEAVTLRAPTHPQIEIRVRLPADVIGQTRNARINRIALEVI